jgi:hypothetical protein
LLTCTFIFYWASVPGWTNNNSPAAQSPGRWLKGTRSITLIIMDTDELSEETYNAVLVTAEKFNHNLVLQFGLLASHCINDDDYLEKAKQVIVEWRMDLHSSINEIFFDVNKPKISTFENILSKIHSEIEQVINIPISKRKFEF